MENQIGFIGQGWIGKHYADDFEHRGYTVVRYALEEPYLHNKAHIQNCPIVFIAVPTPTTPQGFSYSAITDALTILKPGTTAVIKSTVLPGTTEQLQEAFPEIFVLHSPEFLREASAAVDAAHPQRNIIGIPNQTEIFQAKASAVLEVLPKAPFQKILSAREAELVKYIGNCFLYSKVVMMNAFYDVVRASGADWERVREAMIEDPRIGQSHTNPIHASGADEFSTSPGRGAGGHCFIKDFEAFRHLHEELVGDASANNFLQSMIQYNNSLLIQSGKDIDLLKGVYGPELIT